MGPSSALFRVIQRSWNKSPEHRFKDALSFIEALGISLNDDDTLSTEPMTLSADLFSVESEYIAESVDDDAQFEAPPAASATPQTTMEPRRRISMPVMLFATMAIIGIALWVVTQQDGKPGTKDRDAPLNTASDEVSQRKKSSAGRTPSSGGGAPPEATPSGDPSTGESRSPDKM